MSCNYIYIYTSNIYIYIYLHTVYIYIQCFILYIYIYKLFFCVEQTIYIHCEPRFKSIPIHDTEGKIVDVFHLHWLLQSKH